MNIIIIIIVTFSLGYRSTQDIPGSFVQISFGIQHVCYKGICTKMGACLYMQYSIQTICVYECIYNKLFKNIFK